MIASGPFTAEAYEAEFQSERLNIYPAVDAFEQRTGYALDRVKMEDAARVLACPVKKNRANWQHGRVLYALTRAQSHMPYYFSDTDDLVVLDVGTAKGFSALCLQWAIDDAVVRGQVYSVDVIDPQARVTRNSVGDREGVLTLSELLTAWPESQRIQFEHSTGIDWLKRHRERIHVAFVDGKHESAVVLTEGKLLADRQEPGDVVMFDDVQIPGVAKAVAQMDMYDLEYLAIKPEREYAIGVRK